MKKIVVLLTMMVLIVMAGVATAGPVDKSKAAQVACNFWNSRSLDKEALTQDALELVALSWDAFYVFKNRNYKGFVIVSADDCVEPVLGYSFTNDFCKADDMSPELSFWLDGYQQEIDYYRANGVKASEQALLEWQKLTESNVVSPFGAKANSVGPLVTTNWSQGWPYNSQCPIVNSTFGFRAVVGCVATAMAMLIKYYQYPHRGTGSHAYYPNGLGLHEVDFGNTVYDYDNMPDSIGDYSDSIQIDAVAKLMYHCGVAVDMWYGRNGSTASITPTPRLYRSNTLNAMISYFGYSFNAQHLARSFFSDQEWIDILKSQLDASQPILYLGYPVSGRPHCFLCDGYDETNHFHFNWGWSGRGNGFFALNNMATNGTDLTQAYNYNHRIISNLVPHGDDDSLCVIRRFPYTMDFESEPTCWFATDNKIDEVSWEAFAGILPESSDDHHISAFINPKNIYLVGSVSETLYTPAIVTPGHYIVKWQDRAIMPSTIESYTLSANGTLIAERSNVDAFWAEQQAFFDVNDGDTVRLAFYYYGTSEAQNGVVIDDIIIYPEYMTSIGSLKTDDLRLYPNPTTGMVTLQGDARVERIDIADISGRMLQTINHPSDHFNISGLPQGVYFVKITTSKGVCVRKVVKR